MKFIKRYNESFNGKNFFDIQRKLVDDFKSIDDFKEKLKNEYLKFEELIKDNLIDIIDESPNSKIIFDKYLVPDEIDTKPFQIQIIDFIEVYISNIDFNEIGHDKILNQLKKFNSNLSNYEMVYSILGSSNNFSKMNIEDLSNKLSSLGLYGRKELILIKINN